MPSAFRPKLRQFMPQLAILISLKQLAYDLLCYKPEAIHDLIKISFRSYFTDL